MLIYKYIYLISAVGVIWGVVRFSFFLSLADHMPDNMIYALNIAKNHPEINILSLITHPRVVPNP